MNIPTNTNSAADNNHTTDWERNLENTTSLSNNNGKGVSMGVSQL